MYADSIDEDDDPLAGLLYVCDRADIADTVRRAAWDAGPARKTGLSVRTTAEVVGQARTAARSQYAMLAIMVGFTTLALWLLAQAGTA